MSEILHSEEVTRAGITWTWDHYTYYSESKTGYRASVQYIKGNEMCTAWGPTREDLGQFPTRIKAIEHCHQHAANAQKTRCDELSKINEMLNT